MLTRQRQLGGQIAPGRTLCPQFFRYYNQRPIDSSRVVGRNIDKVETAGQSNFHAIVANSTVTKHRLTSCPF